MLPHFHKVKEPQTRKQRVFIKMQGPETRAYTHAAIWGSDPKEQQRGLRRIEQGRRLGHPKCVYTELIIPVDWGYLF